jgi:casein kinase 1
MSSSGHPNGPNIVGNYYKVGRKIGEGSFGVIFEGEPTLIEPTVLVHNFDCFCNMFADDW